MAYILKDSKGSPLKHNGATAHGADFSGEIKSVDTANRTLTILASDESLDRDFDIIKMSGWQLENYIKNPVVLFCHKYDEPAIAACIKILKTKDSLILTHKFPTKGVYPKADIIFSLYSEKVMRASSVSFLPLEWIPNKDEDGKTLLGRIFTKQELLEHSLVPVPANPNATILEAIKSSPGDQRSKELLYQQVRKGLNEPTNELCNVKEELASISAGGPELIEDSGKISVQVPNSITINKGVKSMNIKELKKKKMELLEKLAYVEGDEAETLRQEIQEINEKIKQSFPIPSPDGTTQTADKLNRLIFTDREGKEHIAISIKENFSDIDGSTEEQIRAGNFIRSLILGTTSGLNDVEKELYRKRQQEGTGSTGGWTLGTSVSNRVIDLARAKQVLQKAGSYSMTMPTPEMVLVRLTEDPTVYFRKESGELTESEAVIEPIALKAMVCGCLVRSSIELIEDSSNFGNLIENAMSQAIAVKMDSVGLLGVGVNEPLGIANTEGINTISMGANGGSLTSYSKFSEAMQKVAEANGISTAVIYAPRTHFQLDQLVSGIDNQPLQQPASFQSLKQFYTTGVPITDSKGTASNCSKAFVGDFTKVLYGIRKDVTVEASKAGGGSLGEDAFSRLEILVRCWMRFDVAILYPSHLTVIEGIKAS